MFVYGVACTVVGIYSSAQPACRHATDASAMLIPENTAIADFGDPQPRASANQDEAQMVVATRIGAAQAAPGNDQPPNGRPKPAGLVGAHLPPRPWKNLQSEVSVDLALACSWSSR